MNNKPSCEQYYDSILYYLNTKDRNTYVLRELFDKDIVKCDNVVDLSSLRAKISNEIPYTLKRVLDFSEDDEQIFISDLVVEKYRSEIKRKISPWWKPAW